MYNNEYMHVHKNIFNIIITSVYPVCSGSKRKQVDDSGLDLAKLLDEYDKREERRMTLLLKMEARTREREAEADRARKRED